MTDTSCAELTQLLKPLDPGDPEDNHDERLFQEPATAIAQVREFSSLASIVHADGQNTLDMK